MTTHAHLRLNTGAAIPAIGFGSLAIRPEQAQRAIENAIETGYRLIDTAANYKNEAEVGRGIAASGIGRAELFVTTKLWIADYGHDEALRAFDASMDKLGLDYLDLYLLHWPVPMEFERTLAAYAAAETLLASGRVRALGVSNFHPAHLKALLERTDVVPAVNQIELNPLFSQRVPKAANASHGVVTEAWSPIGGQKSVSRVLEHPAIAEVAIAHGKEPVQVVLRWHIQQGNVAIPRSTDPEHVASNFDVFDFQLSEAEMRIVDGLNENLRGGPDPEEFDEAAYRRFVASRP